jgi:hypothetical protein
MGPRPAADFKRKDGTVVDIVRAAPSLTSSSSSSASNAAAIPLSPLDDALFVRPLVIGWSAFFKGQLEARSEALRCCLMCLPAVVVMWFK